MDELLAVLRKNALQSPADLAVQLGLSEGDVQAKIADYERRGIIRGYHAVINEEPLDVDHVNAVIEVKVTPERSGGFNRIAERISRFDEVKHLYLMSGSYDLLLFVTAPSLKEVGAFVSEKLSTLDHVLSTSTHFMLKTYKEQGFLMESHDDHQRLQVSP